MDAVNREKTTTDMDGAPDRGAGKKKNKIYLGGTYDEVFYINDVNMSSTAPKASPLRRRNFCVF